MISFKVDELKVLRDNGNFYTMIKEKVHRLFDETDDEPPDVPNIQHRELPNRLLEIIDHFKRFVIPFDQCRYLAGHEFVRSIFESILLFAHHAHPVSLSCINVI